MTDLTPPQIADLLNHPAPLWLRELDLSGADQDGANLSGADLHKIDLSEIS